MDKAKDEPSFVASAAPDWHESVPFGDVTLPATLSRDELQRFIARPESQRRIRSVVLARVGPQTPTAIVDDIVQEANLAALASATRPRSTATAAGWLGILTARTVVHHFRRAAVERRWIAPEAHAEEQSGESAEPPAGAWLIAQWLAPILAAHPRDQETYELLVYKARTGETHAEVARAHGMTTAALWNRVHAFKTTYEPRWRRRQESMILFLLFFGAAVAALVAWLFLHPSRAPDTTRPAPRNVPVLTASAAPFEPAQSASARSPAREKGAPSK